MTMTPRLPEVTWVFPEESADLSRSRFLGCMLGGAVGDALGAPIEFLHLEEIRGRFGRQGIRDYLRAYGRVGAITDDTQMSLFTAEGLLRGWVRWQVKGITTYEGVVAHAYLRWLKTQGIKPVCELIPDADGNATERGPVAQGEGWIRRGQHTEDSPWGLVQANWKPSLVSLWVPVTVI